MALTPEQYSNIAQFMIANISNPQLVASTAAQYGLTSADLAQATGQSVGAVNNYLSSSGMMSGAQPTAQPTAQPPMANVSSFEDLRGALQSGSVKIFPKKVAADPDQIYNEGVVDANGQVTHYVATINGQEIPYLNTVGLIPQYKQKTVTQGEGNNAYQVQRDDMSQPPIGFRLRARSSENTGLFNDVNLGYDPQTGTVPPPRASDYYTSGSRDSSTFQNVHEYLLNPERENFTLEISYSGS
jgi:hypothetical protein